MKRTLRFSLISLLLCAPAHAQDNRGVDKRDVEVGDTLVCDTQEQAERYIAHFKGDPEAAIRAVSREESDPSVCGLHFATRMPRCSEFHPQTLSCVRYRN